MAQAPRSRKAGAKRPAAASSARPAPARAAPRTPWLEWLSAGVGLALILATLGLVASELFRADDTPPQLVVRTLSVQPARDGFLVVVRVHNEGGSPAAAVLVEGELTPATGEPETAETTFDFVADHSTRDGGLYFESDPRNGVLALRAKGYSTP